ncbi:MAG: ABC transporter permease [Tissierellia bacterium]|nr:ABC transporter permease [Tissierellia bacterium]
MEEILQRFIPNVLNIREELITGICQTLTMVTISGAFSLVLGIFLGVVLVITRKDGILENTNLYAIIEKIINTFRSIPFVILIALLIPITRAIVGTAIGTKGAIVPLIFGTVPFLSRQIENALVEVDKGVIEAAKSMGSGPIEIIFRVYLREGLAGIIRAITITFISLIGLTAIAGSVGGGGLGDLAIRYGYQRFQTDVTIVTVIILLILISIVQSIGNFLIKKISH